MPVLRDVIRVIIIDETVAQCRQEDRECGGSEKETKQALQQEGPAKDSHADDSA